MGCSSSQPAAAEDGRSLLADSSDHRADAHNQKIQTPRPQPPKTSKKKPTTATPYNRARDRVDVIPTTANFEIDGISLRYAYLSQRGFYPDDPFKANQDAYYCKPNEKFFGVFDGHGAQGDACAHYARDALHKQLKNHLKGKNTTSTSVIHRAIEKAHTDTNDGLAKSEVDDSLSGTTSISAYFHGHYTNRITIANVGDSRAVIGREPSQQQPESFPVQKKHRQRQHQPPTLKAFPLSRDQTPYRKDERERIKATGARVLSLDQLEGLEPIHDETQTSQPDDDFVLGEDLDEDGDPPRVWAPEGDYPGTAFTRSIGDRIAQDLGVYAVPEVLTREITPQDKIVVLASDGVFEFLTNQSVIDICAKFNDPLEACRAVVAEAYELWLQYELRTDDITMICMFIDEVKEGKAGEGAPIPSDSMRKDRTAAPLTDEGLRPVRKHASKEKSKQIEALKRSSDHNTIQDAPFDWKKHATTKTQEEKDAIAEAIQASVMFRNVTDEQREMIYACMESVPVKQGTWVIRQGTVGDRFYIIDDGQFEVRIVPDGETDESGQGGHILHVYEGSRSRNAHPSFGELALMYSAPRSASIVAKTDGHLWALHRSAFRHVLVQAQDHRQELKKALGEIPYFQYLDSDGINKLAAIMDEVTFGRGENITSQGVKGDKMYVIASGACYADSVVSRRNLKAGAWFGDEILNKDGAAYSSTVMAMQTCNLWQLDANVLKQTMGPLLQGSAS